MLFQTKSINNTILNINDILFAHLIDGYRKCMFVKCVKNQNGENIHYELFLTYKTEQEGEQDLLEMSKK